MGSKKKLPIFPTNWPNLANQSTNSKSPREPSMLNVTNSKPLLKKPKLPSNPKKLRSSAFKLKLPKANKTLNAELPRRTKKSITPDVTVKELLNLCNPPLTLKSAPVVKPSESRRRWNLTSMTSKFNSVTLTDNALKPKTRTSKLPSMTHKEPVKTLPNKLLSLTDVLIFFNLNWMKCVPLLNKLNVVANLQKVNFSNPTNVVVSFTLKTPL